MMMMKIVRYVFAAVGLLYTALFLAEQAVAVPIQPGQLDGCQYNLTPFTLSDGQQAVIQCDTAGNLKIAGTVTVGGVSTITVTGNVAAGATDSGNPVKIGGVDFTGLRTSILTSTDGRVRTSPGETVTASDGVNNVLSSYLFSNDTNGSISGALITHPAYLNAAGAWDRMRGDANGGAWVQPSTNSGTSNFSVISAATTNSANVKASAGVVTEINVGNNSATVAYLKLFNKATAPICGTDVPVARYVVPGNASGTSTTIEIALGKSFSAGIGICLTGGIADADITATAANAYTVNLTFK